MRVAIVQEHVDAARGGAETSTIELARALARCGPAVTLVHRGADATPFVRDNVTYLPLTVDARRRAAAAHQFVNRVHDLCARERFDIVHAISPVLCANVYQPRGGLYPDAIAGSLAMHRAPLVRAIRGLGKRFNIRQRFLLRIERLLLTRAHRPVWVAAISSLVQRQVERFGGVPAERVQVVFNGVEPLNVAPAERDELRRTMRDGLAVSKSMALLLFAAHHFRLKGLDALLRAMGAARAQPMRFARLHAARLAIVGRDDDRPYRRLAVRLGVADQVEFFGAAADLGCWLASADALIHPTWYDPCSRVVLEALGFGVPVLTTRLNGAAEAVDPGVNGVLIDDPSDPVVLAEAIERLLRADLRERCAAAAPATAAKLSMARHARELMDLYERVRRGGSAPAKTEPHSAGTSAPASSPAADET